MAATASFLGGPTTELGPVQLEFKPKEIDWADESGWIDAGKTQQTLFRRTSTKTDLLTSQDGTEPGNRVITGQKVEYEAPLGQGTAERLADLVQDILLEKSGDVVNQWMIVNKIGEDDLANLFWLRVTRVIGGIVSTNPLHVSYSLVAPQSESVELLFDAATQRYFGLIFRAYLNDAENSAFPVFHSSGPAAFAWSGIVP